MSVTTLTKSHISANVTARHKARQRAQTEDAKLDLQVLATIQDMLTNQVPMAKIARELQASVALVKRVRDGQLLAGIGDTDMGNQLSTRERERRAQLYVLSRVGKCTEAFKEVEAKAARELAPAQFERQIRVTPLAKMDLMRIAKSWK